MSQAIASVTEIHTHRATLGGATFLFNAVTNPEACGKFVAEQIAKGADAATLKVEALEAPVVPKLTDEQAHEAIVTGMRGTGPLPKIEVGQYDVVGDARSERDRQAAIAAGFAPAMPVFRQGLRATGMERHRAEFDALPLATQAARQLTAQVEAEQRADVMIERQDVRMTPEGRLINPSGTKTLVMAGRAFPALVGRLGMPAGAGQYLPAIDPALRALNVNHWVEGPVADAEKHRQAALVAAKKNVELDYLALRTRKNLANDGERECFAVVTDQYAAFDADKLGKALAMAAPEGARASWVYDGARTKFDVLFFTNINPEEAVAGEFFKAGVKISTDDTGGGGLRVSAGIWQNLCLNFIIIDDAETGVVSLRHLGDPRKLAMKFRDAFIAAQERIGHFVKVWGYAAREDVKQDALVMAAAQGVVTRDEAQSWVGRPAREFLAGVLNGLVERDLVPLPKKDRLQTVQQLLTMADRDTSFANRDRNVITRGTVVNAITRYAHEVNQDPYKEVEIERAAGKLLYPPSNKFTTPAPLPFLPINLA